MVILPKTVGRICACSSRAVLQIYQVVFLYGLLATVWSQSVQFDLTDIRLVGGPANAPNSGRVEVLHASSGNWLNVCDVNYWGDNDGTVACRQLGFPGYSRTRRESYFGEGLNNGSVGGIGCNGDEETLGECAHQPVQEYTGCSGRVAGLICTVPGFLGCYTDDRNNRVFTDPRFTADNLTIGLCLERCRGQGARYAGLENRRDCYCGAEGTQIDIHGRLRDRDCRSACTGNPDEVCGGGGKLSIYDLTLGYCTDPGTPANGERTSAGGEAFRYGANVTFFCPDGFELVGSNLARCVLGDSPQEVRWDEPVPQCRYWPISTTPNSGSGDDEESGTSSAGKVAGIVLALVVLLLLVGIFIVFIIRKRRRRLDKQGNTTAGDHQGNTYSEPHGVPRYQTSPNANTEYQDLAPPLKDEEGPYTLLRKPGSHQSSERDIPEYLELYPDCQDGSSPVNAKWTDNRIVIAKPPVAARQKASRVDKARLPSPEVNENEYSYVDASRFSGDAQVLQGAQPRESKPMEAEEVAGEDSVYYSLPPDAR
ncbi:uncharacterized protein LOC110980576 [Acanthaster planci]|uniref:Uncharacterized protein LOC110980576 n=1 Tax=Acanthaster planci TaxID=133434 RepID=A0A8B7YIL9_ACAPL|nr:uncharacterized protein LOC110980576 [Acanthaster planci]